MLSSSTYKMNKMLFQTLLIQISFCGLFALLPLMTIQSLIITKKIDGSLYGEYAFFVILLFPLLEPITILYFIKPYRDFIKNAFERIREMLRRNGDTTNSLMPRIVVSSVGPNM